MYMGKYKLFDLENLSPLLRKSIMIKNHLLFPESSKQIQFFITFLNNLLKNEIRLNEAYDVISNPDKRARYDEKLQNFEAKQQSNLQPRYQSPVSNQSSVNTSNQQENINNVLEKHKIT